MINVLWIDDQYADPDMVQFCIAAENEGINLVGFASFEEGFEALERDIERFDIILLDGLFFHKRGQVRGEENERGIGKAIARINELKVRKVFPWFVLSGQDKFTRGENDLLIANDARCYAKTKNDDLDRLFKDIKNVASGLDEYRLKIKYNDVFALCDEKYLGNDCYHYLFSMASKLEKNFQHSDSRSTMNDMRKIFEGLFKKLISLGIIPDAIMVGGHGINQSSKFLANKSNFYKFHNTSIPVIHPLVAENLYRLTSVIQDGSHMYGGLKLQVDLYLKAVGNDYFHRACILNLFDILCWFKIFIDEHPDSEGNRKLWYAEEQFEGVVDSVNQDGSAYIKIEKPTRTVVANSYLVKIHKLDASHKVSVIIDNFKKSNPNVKELIRR
jgi:hypothetical protein